MNRPLIGLLALVMAGILVLAPVAAANHTLSVHATYEFGPYGDYAANTCVPYVEDVQEDCDPTDLTQDDSIDFGGVIIPGDQATEFTTGQVSVVDDIWGPATIGGWLCAFFDPDASCEGQPNWPANNQVFCGDSAPFTWPENLELHAIVVFVNGPYFQTLDCDPTVAPSSTTGGVLDPAGGIYLTLSH